jgi:hypothetical protein
VPEFDTLLDEARRQLYQQAQQMLYDDGGTLIPFFVRVTRILRAEVEGVGEVIDTRIRWHLVSVNR